MYSGKRFIQVLEGEKKTVLSVYEEIQYDVRHAKVVITMQNKIDRRMFPDWTMGYENIEPHMHKNIPGLTLFFDDEKVTKPHELLLAFKDDARCSKKGRNV
ncbi:MAG: hypothetical protein ACI85N_001697 [Gammaproteobacteria bacterium]